MICRSFILPLSQVEITIQSILEELQRDSRPVKNDMRPLRSTGAAVSIAISLLEVVISLYRSLCFCVCFTVIVNCFQYFFVLQRLK